MDYAGNCASPGWLVIKLFTTTPVAGINQGQTTVYPKLAQKLWSVPKAPNGTYLSQKHKESSVRCAHERSDKVPLGCARFIVCPVFMRSDVHSRILSGFIEYFFVLLRSRTAHATYKDAFEDRAVFVAFKA
jgi:hypothetical protein